MERCATIAALLGGIAIAVPAAAQSAPKQQTGMGSESAPVHKEEKKEEKKRFGFFRRKEKKDKTESE